jgi:S-adenosylmethionine decarboxylase
MFAEATCSGKHMMCDVREVGNLRFLLDSCLAMAWMDRICAENDLTVLHKVSHQFEPCGYSVIYLLAESHISIHTYPERAFFALDLYSCREYADNSALEAIYDDLIQTSEAGKERPLIVDRRF